MVRSVGEAWRTVSMYSPLAAFGGGILKEFGWFWQGEAAIAELMSGCVA